MYYFFQELLIFLILEMLRIIEGITNILNYLFGSVDLSLNNNPIYILDKLIEYISINNIFNCIILISILIGGILSIISIIKNAINNNQNLMNIITKYIISIISVFIVCVISLIIIDISKNVFLMISDIFNINTKINIPYKILDLSIIDYNNLYNIRDINLNTQNINILFGDFYYEPYQLLPISWKNNGMINPNSFLYIPCFITTLITLISYIYIAISLGKRLYEIILLYIIMPISVSTITIDDGNRFKIWISLFIKKIFTSIMIYMSLFIYTIIYHFLNERYISANTYQMRILNLIFIASGAIMLMATKQLFIPIFGDIADNKNIITLNKMFKKNIKYIERK